MARGYIKIKKERFYFTFHLDKPIEERERRRHYVELINGNLYLALGVHYIMFRFEKELDGAIDSKYFSDVWNKIISIEKLSVSYIPSYNRLDEGIIDFTIYIGLDERNHYELGMAMDWYYNAVDLVH